MDERNISPREGKHLAFWFTRFAVALVCIINLQCCFNFLLFPEKFVGAYELSGTPGIVALQGLAVAFLMWNATYPLVIINPLKYRIVFVIVLVQQTIGLIGESFIFFSIGEGHALLQESILRFIAFDGAGLLLMLIAFMVLRKRAPKTRSD